MVEGGNRESIWVMGGCFGAIAQSSKHLGRVKLAKAVDNALDAG